jgi:hypothetical protein
MDPITAFQVAASVVTFVEYGRVLVSSAYKVYRSPNGKTAQTVELETVDEDLRVLLREIHVAIDKFPPNAADHEIRKLCMRCATIGEELQSTINDLKRAPGGSSRLHYATNSFVVAAKGLWKAGQVEDLNEKLDTIRSDIMLSMVFSIWWAHLLPVSIPSLLTLESPQAG